MTSTPTKLRELCTVITKGTTPTSVGFEFSDEGVRFLRVQNIFGGKVNHSGETLFIQKGVHDALKRSQILPGDVLLSIAGSIGRTGIVSEDAPELNCNQAVAILRTNERVFQPFLRHWLESAEAQGQMRGATVTGTIQNLSLSQTGELQVPLPPLPEQRRIAAILDKADALRTKRREALDQLDRLAQSIFMEMFGHPVSNSKNWPTSSLGDILQFIGNGINLEQSDDANGWPVSRIETIWNGEIDPGRVKYTKGNLADFSKYKILNGDILFSHINSPNHIAKTAIYLGEPEVLIHGINLLRLRGHAHMADPQWLVQLLKHSGTRDYFQGKCKRAVNQASLNQQDIKGFCCITPPLEMQQEFTRKIERLADDRLVFQASRIAMDELFLSLQKRAFQGEL